MIMGIHLATALLLPDQFWATPIDLSLSWVELSTTYGGLFALYGIAMAVLNWVRPPIFSQ